MEFGKSARKLMQVNFIWHRLLPFLDPRFMNLYPPLPLSLSIAQSVLCTLWAPKKMIHQPRGQ